MMSSRKILTLLLLLSLFIGSSWSLLQGQDTGEDPIELTGPVQAVGADTIVISNLVIDISDVQSDLDDIQVGTTVTVSGTIENQVVTATTVVIVTTSVPEATDEPVPEATAEVTPEMTPEVTAEPDADNGEAIIVIIGPVTAINVNVITIFDFDIEVAPDDPILSEIVIGDYIRVEGTTDPDSGDTLVIVAINITIVNVVIIDVGDDDDSGSGNTGNNPPPAPPSSGFNKNACKGGGWRSLARADGSGFKNQGDCIQYANTGR